MKEETNPKTYFWAYDIFGYLLPGLLVLVGFAKGNQWIHDNLSTHWNSLNVLNVIVLIGAAYVVGHIVAALSSYALERLVLRWTLGYPTARMFSGTLRWRWYLLKVLFPGYFRAYSEAFQRKFDQCFEDRFGMIPGDHHDRFWLAWSYISLHHAPAFRRATHFLELYGFSRNMSMGFLLVAFNPWLPSWRSPIPATCWVLISLLSAWFMFVNYTKLLRRLNDEVYRGFVVCSLEKREWNEISKS